MEFDVQGMGYRNYKELKVREGNALILSGLLSEDEANSLGSDMFAAAQELMNEEDFKKLIMENYSKEDLLEMFGEKE